MKKYIWIMLLTVLLTGIFIALFQEFLWGINIIGGTDELHHFLRAYALSRHWVGIYNEPDNPSFFDFYPAGFHLLLGDFIIMSSFESVYYTYIIFKIMYLLIPALLVFLIATKMNWKFGVLSVFFYSTYFQILTDARSHYIYISSPQSYLNTTFITIVSVLGTLLCYFEFLKNTNRNKELKYGVLITLFGVVQGVSHISTYIGYVVNFSVFSMILSVFFLIKRNNYKVVKIWVVESFTLLSLPISFFIYYFPMFPKVTLPPYIFKKVWPSFIPEVVINYAPEISVGLLIILLSFIILYILFPSSKHVHHTFLPFSSKGGTTMLILFVVSYIYVLVKVTKNPSEYNFSGFCLLNGVFPTYIPLSFSKISIVSKISIGYGFMMVALVVLTLYISSKRQTLCVRKFIIMFIIFYFVWFVMAMVFKYYADRIIYYKFILYFIYSMGLIYLLPKVKNRGNFRSLFKKIIVWGIIILILSISVVSQMEKEPSIRDELNVSRLNFGTESPPIIFSSFGVVINTMTYSGEYVLSTSSTLSALATVSHIRTPTYSYQPTYTDHRNWSLTVSALAGRNMGVFFEKYHARYLVIGYADMKMGRYPWRWHTAPISKYNANSHLLLVYIGKGNERVYEWVN